MPGFLPSEDVASLWPEFDLVVHAPLSENCGGIHEAMIAGTPVLVSRVGGLPELVIDGVTGRCVNSRSPEALRDAIVSAVRDPSGSRRMAAAGLERVRTLFDVGRTALEILAVYQKLLGSPRPEG
jgi:glycosyltransferase involved in cell wall biosynthesis